MGTQISKPSHVLMIILYLTRIPLYDDNKGLDIFSPFKAVDRQHERFKFCTAFETRGTFHVIFLKENITLPLEQIGRQRQTKEPGSKQAAGQTDYQNSRPHSD